MTPDDLDKWVEQIQKEIIDEDMSMGRLDRRELIKYRKTEQELKYFFKNLIKMLKD